MNSECCMLYYDTLTNVSKEILTEALSSTHEYFLFKVNYKLDSKIGIKNK